MMADKGQSRAGSTVIGILGGIGSGKSLVTKQLQQMGAEVFSADEAGHKALDDPSVINTLVSCWGDAILDSDGRLDRKAIAERVFQGPDAVADRELLERLVHPLIAEQMRVFVDSFEQRDDVPLVVIDAALLLEAGWDAACDELIYVAADEETRWNRCQQRGWTRQQWEAREATQLSLDEKRARSTLFVDNNSDQASLLLKLEAIFGEGQKGDS